MDGLKLAHAARDRWPPNQDLAGVEPGSTSTLRATVELFLVRKPYQASALVEELRAMVAVIDHSATPGNGPM
jgi:hypothetical protein